MSKKRKKRWGSWEAIGEIFAEGGQGRLYLVKNLDDSFEEIHVLKELKNPKRKKRFEREVAAITNIERHPNVIQLVDSGIFRDENHPCYVMPRADCSLDVYLPEIENNPEESFEIFKLICAGLIHLHSADIIHRDLKPENILIFSGKPKISDFGICLVVNENRLTSTSEAIGPRFYMAPELEDGKNLDVSPSCDLYSLGKILYFILSKGNIFSREKFYLPKYNLAKLFDDPRYDIFTNFFSRSISANIYERYKNATELLLNFNELIENFLNHPRTRIISKLGSFERIDTKTYDLSTLQMLDTEELKELVSFYRSHKATPPIELFKLSAENFSGKHINDLISLLLENELHIDVNDLVYVSGIVALHNDPEQMHLSMKNDYVERFLLYALENNSLKITDNVARISFFTLRQHKSIILKLSKHFVDLSIKSKRNFLLSSYQTEFDGKLQLFCSILENNDLDDISFEAVVAGLCLTKDYPTLERLASLGDNLENEDRIGAFGRGIVLGSQDEAIEFFKKYKWNNPVIKLLCNIMGKNEMNIDALED